MPADPNGKVAALAALQAADESSNQSSQAATINLVGISIAYLAITSLTLAKLPAELPQPIFAFIALPVILMQSYQMLLAASVMKRASSAQQIEAELLKVAGLDGQRWRYGSKRSDSVLNIDHIGERGATRKLRAVRMLLAMMAYVGFYLLGLGYTTYVVIETFKRGVGFWSYFSAAVYALLWAAIAAGAIFYFLSKASDCQAEFE